MILNFTGTGNIWAGYVSGINSYSPILSASADIYLPKQIGFQPHICCATEYLGIWVGIGGIALNNAPPLWQAGIMVEMTQLGPKFLGFYEDWPGGQFTTANPVASPGDTITIQVSYSSGNNTGWFSLYDFNTSAGWGYVYQNMPYRPSLTTADYITEEPQCTGAPCSVIPVFDSATFFGMTASSYGGISEFSLSQTYAGYNQWLFPSLISAKGYFGVIGQS